MSVIYSEIRFARGPEERLPELPEGKPVITKDTKKIFVGSSSGNVELAKQEGVDGLAQRVNGHDEDIADINEALIGIEYNIKTFFGAKGDGTTDDTTAIQTAFNTAKTLGGIKLKFPAGSYKVTSTLRIYANTHVEMDKNATILRSHPASILVNGDSTDSFTGYNGNGNITWDGGTFDGNIIAFPYGANHLGLGRGKNLTFRNITFKDVINDHIFDMNACEDVLIENCRFLGYKDATVDASRYYAEAIQISNHTQLGFTGFGAWDGTPCRNVTIRDCYFGASGTTGTGAWAVAVGGHGAVHDLYNSNILIEGCTFDGMTYAAVRNFKFKDVRIIGNDFINCSYGVMFSNVAPGTESSKLPDGVTDSGLPQSGDGTIIDGNHFRGTFKCNILATGQVSGSNIAKVSNITITNNHFKDQDPASTYDNIFLTWCDKVKFAHNTIDGSYRAFKINFCSDVDIDTNTIINSKNDGVWAFETAGSYINLGHTARINARFNTINGAGRTGITIQNTDDFDLVGNKIYSTCTEADNTRDAVYVDASSKNGKVFNNKIRMATTGNQNKYGVEVTSSCTNVQTFNNDSEGKTGKQVNASVGGFEGYYMQSPDGTRYKMTVANGGTFTATAG